ncbi:fungal specific transcription factor domain-containing protein [Rutstroemia sp. NJR-2017a WRK4]|nr:fungal specific transcription factor domain-containing protein [Rutstroemia sp. NJR-2017a WRK4]
MTPTPPSTTSSSFGGHSPEGQYRVVRKRNRIPLSCGPSLCPKVDQLGPEILIGRRLKCNRSHPCENCTRRGDASSCSYAAPGTRKKNQSQGATSPDDMQNRIDRLEGLVLSLMTNGAQSAGPAAAVAAINRSQSDSAGSSFPREAEQEDDDMIREDDEDDSDVDGVANSLGVLKVDSDKGKTTYIGDSHWHLVLADIAEVKNYFNNHKRELETNYERIRSQKPSFVSDGPAFLFNAHTPATDVELRAELPSKSAVDKLVTRYFNTYDPAVHIIHSPTFHKELQCHWQDPSKTSIVWLGLLYSILCLAMQSYAKIGDEPPEWKGKDAVPSNPSMAWRGPFVISFLMLIFLCLGHTLELAAEYRVRTVQCLINSDYTKSSLYTIETLILYVHGEYASRWDAEVGLWVIIGMITRLAMRMGYHRDPSNYPGISPFQGEMRRRIWAFVRSMDTMFSFQLALPSMIRDSDCDARLPRNIFEDEFGPDSKVLPPARPSSEPTPVSYMLAKVDIAWELNVILEQMQTVNGKGVGYDEVLKRDAKLRELKNNLAPHLRLRPMEECMHDPATLLMHRFNVDILWQKTMCVLHRKYLARGRTNPRYAHSRRTAVEASMEILRHQAKLHQESQPGGRLRSMKWAISSLAKHDYLLAAMIVCLELHYGIHADSLPEKSAYEADFWTTEQRDGMLQALETSQKIWSETVENSMEAFKATKTLNIILEKLKASKAPASTSEATTTAEAFARFDDENLKPEHSAAMTLGMLSGGLSPNSAAIFNAMGQSPSRFGNMDLGMGDSSGGTGLTPNFPMDNTNPFAGMNAAASPFSMFGNAGTVPGMAEMPANLDWDAWDSFIQNGNAIDPAFQFYPPNIEESPPAVEAQPDGSTFGNGPFMGANAPGR